MLLALAELEELLDWYGAEEEEAGCENENDCANCGDGSPGTLSAALGFIELTDRGSVLEAAIVVGAINGITVEFRLLLNVGVELRLLEKLILLDWSSLCTSTAIWLLLPGFRRDPAEE
jgi:hypothetical protein